MPEFPWLRYFRNPVKNRDHFWPFGGWAIPASHSVVTEFYPTLFSSGFLVRIVTATGTTRIRCRLASSARRVGSLPAVLTPNLSIDERQAANMEGWILGVA
jgi:hypothetical protein